MQRWLMKSEPANYAWQNLCDDGRCEWDGVRNYQAANNMKKMQIGDEVLFYHSITDKHIVGIAHVTKRYYPDPSDATGRFGMVDLAPVRALNQPVTLAAIKANPNLCDIALIKQVRLSVMPISNTHWDEILRMSV